MIQHSYDVFEDWGIAPLAVTIFKYKLDNAELWQNIDWSAYQVGTETRRTPTSWTPLNHYQCILATPVFGKPPIVVSLVELQTNTVAREWPEVTCEEGDFTACASKIKTLGYLDQCEQAAINLHKYPLLRTFPGNCSETWNHRDENGVLQKCGL